jgi:putative ABC transport system substrate-binding protein
MPTLRPDQPGDSVNKRDAVLALLALIAAPFGAAAQEARKVPRVGFLGPVTPADFPKLDNSFREGLRELGFVEGGNMKMEYRWADGRAERLPALAAELVREKVDAIFAITSAAARAAKEATTSIPIVFVAVSDPVRYGLVASFARPGANMTGLGHLTPEVNEKRLQLLKEAVPSASRVAVLWNSGYESHEEQLKDLASATRALGLSLQPVEVQNPEDLEGAFQRMKAAHVDALMILPSSMTHRHLSRIADHAVKHHLPSIMEFSEYAEAGGLLMYGPSYAYMFRRAGNYMGRILKGANPADLPVEQPSTFEFIVNLKTAKALGIVIPQSVLLRADALIQ